MADAKIKIVNDHGTVILGDSRDVICMLEKDPPAASPPTGTMFIAYGDSHTYAFGRAPTAVTGQNGIKVQMQDAAGNVLFDALKFGRLMKPVGEMHEGPMPNNQQHRTTTKTFPSGRTYAVVFTKPTSGIRCRDVAIDNPGGFDVHRYALDDIQLYVDSISGGTVTVQEDITLGNISGAESSVPYTESGQTSWQGVVIDVTNF